MIQHPIPPVYDENSNILILGSFPSVKSREAQFFYGHPRNRFWQVMAAVFEEKYPETVETVSLKRDFLLRRRIALWDVVQSCDIKGSSDASIQNVTANDLRVILDASPIERIYLNGKTAEKMYRRYAEGTLQKHGICLPSTSPANAAWSLERLVEAWKVIRGKPEKRI